MLLLFVQSPRPQKVGVNDLAKKMWNGKVVSFCNPQIITEISASTPHKDKQEFHLSIVLKNELPPPALIPFPPLSSVLEILPLFVKTRNV